MNETLLAGRYRIKERVAAGGMGTVWKAEDEVLKRPVAVKLLQDGFISDPVMAERFRREALLAASISHPNMANVYDYIEDDGHPAIVMELVEAETLAQRLSRTGTLSIEEAVRIGSEVLAALQAAHDTGIVHRDVKPANIMLAPGRAKVTDFGIARATGDATLTQTGSMMGTAHYAAPEQIRGDTATPASDIYAVGVLLYEALTGQRPFVRETALAAAAARLSEEPPRPRSIRTDIPEPVESVVLRALSRNPAERYSSAREMREALEAATKPDDAFPATMPLPRNGEHTQVLPAVLPAEEHTLVLPVAEAPVKRRRLLMWRSDPRRTLFALAAAALILAVVLIALFSHGPSGPVVMPDFRGMQVSEARARAEKIGLEVRTVTRDVDAVAGRIFAQSIAPGARVRRGSSLMLTVASGTRPCCIVPSLSGLSRADAASALANVRLAIGRVTLATTASTPGGTVLAQDPPAGTRLEPGESVDLLVAAAPETGTNDHGGHGKGKKERD